LASFMAFRIVTMVHRHSNLSVWPISKAQTPAELAHATYAAIKTTSTQMKLAKLTVAESGGNDVKSDRIAMGNITGSVGNAKHILVESPIGGKAREAY
jgi:hypothetical protein